MNKQQLFNLILSIISETCDVDPKNILTSCRRQSIVDARVLLVAHAKNNGLTTDDLMRYLNKKNPNSICAIHSIYYLRIKQSYFFRLADDYVSNKIKETLKEPEKNQPNKK